MPFDFLRSDIEDGRYEPEGLYLAAPFEGRRRITQQWGENPEYYRQFAPGGVPLRGHNGLDFALPEGARLFAVDRGRVVEIGFDRAGYGRYIKLVHRWGESLYAHMQAFTVESGAAVERGQVIGYADNTGLSTGPHLHFAIRVYPYNRADGWGGFTDPLPFLHPADFLR